jgi:hypothetical protein
VIIAETNFWQALEYRVSEELAGFEDKSLRYSTGVTA